MAARPLDWVRRGRLYSQVTPASHSADSFLDRRVHERRRIRGVTGRGIHRMIDVDAGAVGAEPIQGQDDGQRRGAELQPSDPVVLLAYAALRRQADALVSSADWRERSPSADEVHRMRVVTRRARSALRVFRDALPNELSDNFAEELKWLADLLGEVRDVDVHREQLPGQRAALPKRDAKSLRAFDRHLEDERERALARLRVALQSDRYTHLSTAFRAAVTPEAAAAAAGAAEGKATLTIGEAADRYVAAATRRLLKRGGRIQKSSQSEALHALRKEGKRFRYLLEFFKPFTGERFDRAHERLVDLQDVLGAYQDAFAGIDRLTTYAAMPPGDAAAEKTPTDEIFAIGQLVGLHRAAAAEARKRFRKRWRGLDAALADLPDSDAQER